jgi:hypothetical protein
LNSEEISRGLVKASIRSFFSSLLERFSRNCDVPAFGEELVDRAFLNAFLDAELIIQKMIREGCGVAINVVDANAIAVAIGADQADGEIGLVGLRYRCLGLESHNQIG